MNTEKDSTGILYSMSKPENVFFAFSDAVRAFIYDRHACGSGRR
jgi:hypothetical protein